MTEDFSLDEKRSSKRMSKRSSKGAAATVNENEDDEANKRLSTASGADDDKKKSRSFKSKIGRTAKSVGKSLKRLDFKSPKAGNGPREIMGPTDFVHVRHVETDKSEKTGFKGLPKEWEELLLASGITQEDMQEHPEEIVDVLRFHFEGPKPTIPSKDVLKGEMMEKWTISVQDPNKLFRKEKKLGAGAGGVVYKVTDLRTGDIKAVKISPKEELTFIKQEIALQAMSEHANIVQYEETIAYKESVWISMEFIDGGNLYDLIGKDVPKWQESMMAYVCQQSLIALAFMHRKFLMHRDIKSDNILVGRNGVVKLADFGFAAGLTREESKRKSRVGTPYWMAPEVIQQRDYDAKIDVWSLGITAFEMAEHDPPFFEDDPMRALYRIVSQEEGPKLAKPKEWSETYNQFLAICLKKDPAERGDSEDLLMNNDFIKLAGTRQEFSVWCTTVLDMKAAKK